MALPRPADAEIQLLLQTVWNLLASGEHWPKHGVVDRRLYRDHGIDIEPLRLRTPDSLLLGGRQQGGAPANPEEQLRLTIVGAASCTGTDEVVELFLQAVQASARVEGEHADASEDPMLRADVIIPGASDGKRRAAPEVWHLTRQLGLLLMQEPWVGSSSLYDGGWTLRLTRQVRPFVGVTSLQEYWQRREALRPTTAVLATPASVPSVTVVPSQAIDRLRELRTEAATPEVQREGGAHSAWRAKVVAVMATALGPTSDTLQSFKEVSYSIGFWTGDPGEAERDAEYFAGQVQRAAAYIEAAIYELELHLPDRGASAGTKQAPSASVDEPIFIVHGRDDAQKYQLVRLLERTTDRDALILHELPNSGATVLEKLERHVQAAGYAVVLLTADDEGRLRGAEGEAPLVPRGRQNVILELGMFIGALGRSRVAVLYEDGVELPSDLQGMVYIRLDAAGAWRSTLLKELAFSGIAVNYERIP